ncbi:MAG: dTDP-4-dehydrorhamnose reductase [Pseudomonadales bacterium]
MQSKILLLGAHGQVGRALQAPLAKMGKLTTISRADCDLANADQLAALLTASQADIIVNAAAYTQVDQAETEPEFCHVINTALPAQLAEFAKKHNAVLMDYSTDYVFDGTKPDAYTEQDNPSPLGVYGASKQAGLQAIIDSGGPYIVPRVSWVYSSAANNFATTILRLAKSRTELKVVDDQYGAPTSAAFIADTSAKLLQRYLSGNCDEGVYHMAPSGVTTWHGFATALVQAALNAGIELALTIEDIHPISSSQYPFVAPRPLNSRMDTSKLQLVLGEALPSWQQPIDHTINEWNTYEQA